MNQVIIFCGVDLIFIASAYAIINVFLKRDRKHAFQELVIVFGSAVLAWLLSHVLKGIIAHPRPDLTHALITPDDTYSLPSGHATFMFALAYAMYLFDKPAGKILFVLAIATGVARVLAGVHYWYDIVGGLVLGIIVAQIISSLIARYRA
jgi:undecaprenyl-diphosphatase